MQHSMQVSAMNAKQGLRIAAITSGPIASKAAFVACPIFRSGIIEGLLCTHVKVNGDDSSAKIARMLKRSRFSQQIKILALNGIAIAGLNVVDAYKLSSMFGISFSIVTRKKPRKELLMEALDSFAAKSNEDVSARKAIVEKISGEKQAFMQGFYFQGTFIPNEETASNIIEALRISHIISRGVATGESKGRI
ncbi:MAG: DUF99 family protein [Candidatus Micrarchaeaceae archaeon]